MTRLRRASVVVDLGFGDAGKGLVTDHLVRATSATVVVRYNGGAQAGHQVVAPDGRRHTFAQVGAGSFVPGVRTVLAAPMVVHPTALLVEIGRLEALGVEDLRGRVAVSGACRIVTPYHQALGRLRELARGPDRHGSCGVGVGEAVADGAAHPGEAIHAADLADPARLRARLAGIRARALRAAEGLPPSDAPEAPPELALLSDPSVTDRWIAAVSPLVQAGMVQDDEVVAGIVGGAEVAVFEGAQGVLLDGDRGFHPHTTWSDCTTHGALDLLARVAPGAEVRRLGVLRTHLPRHGPGPLPTETDALTGLVAEHNRANRWQGPVRLGWFDPVLARHALAATGGVDALVLTHCDLLPRLEGFRFAEAHRIPGPPGRRAETVADLGGWLAVAPEDLEARAGLTARLLRAAPVYETVPAHLEAVREVVEAALGVPVAFTSHGPCAADVVPVLAGRR